MTEQLRRTAKEIETEILQLLLYNGTCKQTQIMYKVNASHKTLRTYITFLTENELIKESLSREFTITKKGISYFINNKIAIALRNALYIK